MITKNSVEVLTFFIIYNFLNYYEDKKKKKKKKSALRNLYIIRNELQYLCTAKLSCCDPQPYVKLLKVNYKLLFNEKKKGQFQPFTTYIEMLF